jgi:hypothetical protein
MNLIAVIRVGFYLMCGVFACTAQSQDKLYQCTVKQILEVDEAGYLKPMQALGVTHLGDTFTVNRSTGEVWGKWVNTKHAESLKVVDQGGGSNNLKISAVIKHWNPTHFVLEVVDFEPKLSYAFSGIFKFNHIAGICK